MLHSIYDLTTACSKTSGDVPAKLVGASTTVVGSKMYLFGGRLVTERRMVSDLYVFDLETLVWEKLSYYAEDDVPRARYFHSADAWDNHLIIFGGMSNQPDSPNPDELCVLNDVRFFDLSTRRWLSPIQTPVPPGNESLIPRSRYAHLSSVTADRLFIIGGQDFYNTWLDDVCVYDLRGKAWVQRREYPRHCGTYRSVAVSSNHVVRLPQEENARKSASALGPPGSRFRDEKTFLSPPGQESTAPDSMLHLPYSAAPTEDYPANIYLYSNYNFTDVKRELEVFSPLPDNDFTMQDRSSAMTGTTNPPGLRFPTGAILGTHLIIAGTYLAHSYQAFSIWVLDLVNMTWSRIDPGKAVETGSWFRSCLWADANKFMIFGNRDGNLVDDYNRRLLSWDHVAIVDLEAFGIYQPPPLKLDVTMQQLGLSALEEQVLTDFEIICDDGRTISCSRKILEERWPWFKNQRRKLLETAIMAAESLPTSPMHIPLPELPGALSADDNRPDPRLTPRAFELSEPYPITLALLQYFYSTALLTPLQHAPAVLSQLLVLAVNYQITHLESLVKHAMHRALSNATSVGVYEVATLCSCRSLQIRALKTVMSYTQKKPGRGRSEKDGGGAGGGRPDGGSGGGGPPPKNTGYVPDADKYSSRPRGTSDARWRTGASESAPSGYGYSSSPLIASGKVSNGHRHISRVPTSPSAALLSPPLTPPPRSPRNRPDPVVLPPVVSSEEDDEPTELPLFTQPTRRHDRSMSTVSIGTDSEIRAVADLMTPTVRVSGNEPSHGFVRSSDMDESILPPPYGTSEGHRSHPPVTPSRSGFMDLDSDSEVERNDSNHVSSFHLSRPRPGPIRTSASSAASSSGYTDYSDTPSLLSSASSYSHGTSPGTPSQSAFDHSTIASPLSIIPERQQYEDPELSQRFPGMSIRDEEHDMFAAPPYEERKTSQRSPTTKIYPQKTMSIETLTSSNDTATMLPIPGSPRGNSFGRFLGGNKKAKESSRDLSLGSSDNFSSSRSVIDSKGLKAEQKKMKKEEAKARKEKLAIELKERAKARAAQDKESLKSQEKKSKDVVASMWGDGGGGVITL